MIILLPILTLYSVALPWKEDRKQEIYLSFDVRSL